MTKSYTSAMEGIFDPEATVDSLLATVKENITSKVTSVDQAADLENRLSEEAAEFNSMLATISTAMRQCEAGEITKEEALAAAKPCVDALKERCEALKLGGVDVKDDDITENEIAMLREYIVGCKDIVAAHKEELQDCPITQNEEKSEEASESLNAIIEGFMDPATESQSWQALKGLLGKETRNARKFVKEGKSAMNRGDNEAAVTAFENAKKIFDNVKKDLTRLPRDMWDTISSWLSTGLIPIIYSFLGEGGWNEAPNKNVNVAAVINYLNRAMKKCDTLIAQCKSSASEGVLSYLGNMDVANEASLAMSVRNSNDAKNATALYKNAKKLYAMGSKDKAKTYMQQAKAKYEKCLEAAKKIGKPHKVERTVGTASVSTNFVAFNKDTDVSYTAYTVPGMAYVVRYFEDRVDTCEAYLRQWANKAGNKDLQETKEMLKKERQEEKARIRAERKAAKEKAAAESAMIEAQVSALESIMDGYELDLSMDAAMEAEGSDMPASTASGIGVKLRAAFGKMKSAAKNGDTEAAAEADKEIKEAAKELDDASKKTDDEGKKKLGIAAKIGIAAAAAAVLVVGEVALGQLLGKKASAANKSGDDLNTLTRLIVRSSDTLMKGANKAAKLASKGVGKVTDKANAMNLNRFAKKTAANNTISDQAAHNKAQNKNINTFRNNEDKIGRVDYALRTAADRLAYKTRGSGLTFTSRKKGNESFSELEGADFLTMLAMEEANFTDDVPLTEIENEEGRGFDDEAQGEDLTDEAIVGVDDLDDEDEVEESVLESTLSVMMLEDGLDPDED